jgi:hypothetical protein
MVRRVQSESFHEENSDCAGRGAFSPEHRRLHDCAPAARSDEGLTANSF